MNNTSLMNYTPIGKLFQNTVKQHPNQIAIKHKNNQLTYSELDAKANQLAIHLQSLGVRPGTFVALSVLQDINFVVYILAILKAGGVYIPIDPSYPKSRIQYILDDAKPLILLTQSDLLSKFNNSQCSVVSLDVYRDSLQKTNSFIDYSLVTQPNELAYIIYTSGSTGKPKGVMIEHKSFPQIALARANIYPNSPTILLLGSISFDISILSIFYTLVAGGTICIPENESYIDPYKILELIDKYDVNFLLSVPSFYTLILQKNKQMHSLRHVSLAGETLPSHIPELHAHLAPNAFLYNEYGPTEYAIGATLQKIYDPISHKMYPITIGKPLPNTEIYILDNNLQHSPTNEKGEIYIGGESLARGYLNKDGLTQERFISVSFNHNKPIRLYKTGDFGRILSNGTIDFLGRIDHQVKLRGYRIELGEIEYSASQCHGVHEAITLVVGEDEANKQLVLFFSGVKEILDDGTLKSYLSFSLPTYMIPSHIVHIQKFPLTSHGKIDRDILSTTKILPSGIEIQQQLSPSLEQSLVHIWKLLLKIDKVSINDNFFDLGGNSIQLVTMQTHIENILHIQVPIIDLFTYPTIALLSKYLNNKQSAQSKNITINPTTKTKSAFTQFKQRNIKNT